MTCKHCGAEAGRSLRFIAKSALGLYEHPSWKCGTYVAMDGRTIRGDKCYASELGQLRQLLRPVLKLRVATPDWWSAFEELKRAVKED